MRPHLNLRALCAMTALGALCLATSLAVLPGTAQSDDTTGTGSAHAAVAADITPGKSRLNVLAGLRAAVNGRVGSGLAGRRALLSYIDALLAIGQESAVANPDVPFAILPATLLAMVLAGTPEAGLPAVAV